MSSIKVLPAGNHAENRGAACVGALIVLSTLSAPHPRRLYPTRTVEIIVSYGAGGSTDIVARTSRRNSPERLGQPFVVLNRPGASGTIGIKAAMRAKPDGYTLYVGYTSETVVVPQISKTAQVFDGGRFRADRDHRPRASGADGVEERQGRQPQGLHRRDARQSRASTPTAAATAARRT